MPERIFIEEERSEELRQQHLARYEFAATYAKGRIVLDVACGSGYGSAILSRSGAARVTGIDRSEDAIHYAKRRYSMPNLEFIHADLESIEKLPTSALIVSFETIEHLRDPHRFLSKIRDALVLGGNLIISTPIRRGGKTGDLPTNPYHFQEWSVEEFSSLLQNYFSKQEFFFQFNFKKRWYPLSRTLASLSARLFHPSDSNGILNYRVSRIPVASQVALEKGYIVAVCLGSLSGS